MFTQGIRLPGLRRPKTTTGGHPLPPLSAATVLVIGTCLLASGCAGIHYKNTKTGAFEGRLIVEWIEPNLFIYEPDPQKPLTFTSSDGRVITPRKMVTDGGSIPPVFWGIPGFSPWGYAPGYIIHDWLFEQHHCGYSGHESYTFDDSARILSEAIKTQMETGKARRAPEVMWAIHEAVSSSIALDIWDNGRCRPVPAPAPPPDALRTKTPGGRPIFSIDFDTQPRTGGRPGVPETNR